MPKRLSIDEILEKAFTTSDLSTGGLLAPDQAARFVQGVISESVILKEVRKVPMIANKRQIDKIAWGSDILQKPNVVGTIPSATSKPTTSKVTLDAQEIIVAIDLGYDALEDSIEGKNLFDTILDMTNEEVAFELEKLLIQGDTAGETSDYLEILDGLIKQITSHSEDAASQTMDDDILFDMLKILPEKYLKKESAWRFYVSPKAKLDYVKALADKNVDQAFVRYLLENRDPYFQGIPVVKVPAISTYNIGSASPASNGSYAFLIKPSNIVWGVHRDITYEFDRVPRKRIVEVTMTMRVDFKLEEEDAVVEAYAVKHST